MMRFVFQQNMLVGVVLGLCACVPALFELDVVCLCTGLDFYVIHLCAGVF